MTLTQFKVDLQQLSDAITSISQSASVIDECTSQINMTMQTTVDPNWATPTESTFAQVQQVCTSQMAILSHLLTEMITRMKAAYHNYLDAEQANVSNLR